MSVLNHRSLRSLLHRSRRLLGALGLLLLLSPAWACSSAPPASSSPATTVRLTPPLLAPLPPTAPRALDAGLPVDPRIRKGTLDNGLTYYVRHNAAPEHRAELWLVVNAGSLLEDEDQRGLAHFVEHMAFNGTRHFERQELVDYLESIGMRFGPDINAYTSYDETVYLLRVPTNQSGSLERGLEILEDWAGGIAFAPDEIDKERGVVIEEWRLGRGAEGRLIDAQIPVLFARSRYAERLPIGERRVLETARPETLERFYRDWYRPDLMAVIAIGDFDPDRIERMITKRFSGLSGPDEPRERTVFDVPGHEETLFATFTDPELTVTSVSVFTKLPRRPEGTVGDYRRGLVEALYHGMINDRLYEIGHRPDPPFLYAYSETASLVRTAEADQQEAGAREGGVLRGLEALLTEIERVRRFGFTEGEVERTKKALLRAYERTWIQRANRSSASYAAEYSRNFLEHEPIPGLAVELELARRFLPEITLEEVNALAGLRTTGANRVILLTAPEEAADALPSEEQLLATFERARNLELEPYQDSTPDTPLLAEEPTPGTIVERREIPEIGVHEWTLSNGVRVVLKPTDFREDQVLLDGFSPGGHSLVSDEDHLTASNAAEIVSLGGLGEHDELALAKLMAGKVVDISPYVDELEEGILAGGSAEDVRSMFQLVYLALTQPRLDLEAIRSYKDRLKPFLENRLADPEQVFVEQMYRELTGNHPRRQPLTPERLEAIDPERALEIYRERFADASDFTFVIVGTFDPAEMEEPVATYLGALPSLGREETWRDVGIERPAGPVEITVHRGLEPKAQVWMVLTQPIEPALARAPDNDTARAVRALAQALKIRLRDVLREDLGAVYQVDVGADVDWRPKSRVSLSIEFGCSPDRAAELVETIHREIEAFREGQVKPELVEKVRQILLRERELAINSNHFWLGTLAAAYRSGQDPTTVLGFEDWVDNLTAERLADTARRFVRWESRIVGTLLPRDEKVDRTSRPEDER